MENNPVICPSCHQSILSTYYFCPNCGIGLKEKIMPVPIITQIGIYALSILVPPLGYWPGIKYALKKNPSARMVGIVAIVLTTLSAVLTVWAIFALMQVYLNQFRVGGLL